MPKIYIGCRTPILKQSLHPNIPIMIIKQKQNGEIGAVLIKKWYTFLL